MTVLEGIKVLDVTQVVAGSFASMQLADLGADVVKIERPGTGEMGRSNPPFVGDRSAYFMSVNRNKKSVTLDLSVDEGREAFLRLAEVADVVVENLKPGAMDRLGLGYDDVSARNDDIIYCSVSGFGHSGPFTEYPALDIVVQAFGGNMSITGPPEGKPYRAGIPVADIAGSMYAAQGVLAALLEREFGGGGTHVDVAMADGLLSWLTVRAGYTFATGEAYPRTGNELDEFVPYGVFEASDGYLALAAVTDHHWRRLCEAIGRPELGDDERFATKPARREHREELEAILDKYLAEESAAEWMDRLARDVPLSPVNDTAEVWETEHVRAREMVTEREVDGQPHRFISPALKFDGESPPIRRDPPALGEHTEAELRAVGYDDEAIRDLRDRDAI